MKPTRQQLVDAMAEAMAREEGFYVAGSIAEQNKNPGNLRTWGTMPISAGGYAKFPTVGAGWEALKRQITINIWGNGPKDIYPLRASRPMSFREFFAGQRQPDGVVERGGYSGYSPAADKNNPDGYAKFVYGRVHAALKLPPEITVETPIWGIAND